jgi:hypothetical protein
MKKRYYDAINSLMVACIYVLNSSTVKDDDQDIYYYIKDRVIEISEKIREDRTED